MNRKKLHQVFSKNAHRGPQSLEPIAGRSRRQFAKHALAGIGTAFILACGQNNSNGDANDSSDDDDDDDDSSSENGDSASSGQDSSATSQDTDPSSSSEGDDNSTSTEDGDESSSMESSDDESESTTSEDSSASSSDESTTSDSTSESSTDTSSDTDSDDDIPGSCTLYPEQQEGPYYDNRPVMTRQDISEGLEGIPLSVEMRIVRADGCTPIVGANIDIWHADVRGVYSEYPNMLGGVDASNDTFLRGRQATDKNGWVRFRSIFPGWYPGRTTHIHFKVWLSGSMEITSQMYFPEDKTAEIYKTAPYDDHGPKDTSNASDGVIQQDSGGVVPPLVELTKSRSGYVSKLLITVAER
jgi:protocatechuate 3,4-dioxygenase beta subunit